MPEERQNGVKIITVASGKGGVGKTNISLNLALALLDYLPKVSLIDADLGLANVDVLLGQHPEHSLVDFLEDRCQLENIMVTGPRSLNVIPGGSALENLPDFKTEAKGKITQIFRHLNDQDALVVDVSAGISDQVLHFFEAAGIPILVVVPEPTSLTDAYALLKTYQKRGNNGPVFLLVNQVKTAKHAATVYDKLQAVVKRFLDIPLESIGYVLLDPHVPHAVTEQTPFISLYPDTAASICVKKIAARLTSDDDPALKPGDLKRLLFSSPDSPKVKEEVEEDVQPPDSSPQGQGAHQSSGDHGSDPDFTGHPVGLLIKDGHISRDQALYAKKVQEKMDTPKKILVVLRELGYVSEEQIKETLTRNRTQIRLGSLLAELGYITDKQLAMALESQGEGGGEKSLREILVENHHITENEFVEALSMNLGFPFVEPTLENVDRSLLKKASKEFFQKHKLLPLREEKGCVNVAFVDPLDNTALEAAAGVFGSNLTISITLDRYVHDTLEAYDRPESQAKTYEVGDEETSEIVDRIIHDALERNVSDIHIEPLRHRVRIRFRKDGTLIHHLDMSKDLGPAIVSRLKVMASADISEKPRHQDGQVSMRLKRSGKELDLRLSFYVTLLGEKVVMRILTKQAELYKVKDLGMGSRILDRFREEVLDLPSGVVLITGPTGAGKTTTLYAAVDYCNNIDTNIITAEEPVEYVIEGISQCSIDPKIGLPVEETLRHMLRQDPDIIVLGEIRDKFSAETAIHAALTGHKVITTFHTEDSIGGLLRLMNMEIDTFLISSTVVCVVAQRLLKKVCPHCKDDYIPTAKELRRLHYKPQDIQRYRFQSGTGCQQCDFTGYLGRIGVFETLILNEPVKDAVLSRKTSCEIRRISRETTGLITLFEDGIAKAAKGITSVQEVLKKLPLPEAPRPLEQIIRLIGDIP